MKFCQRSSLSPDRDINGESSEPTELLDSGQCPKHFQRCLPGEQVMHPIPHQEVKLRSKPHPVRFMDSGVFVFESGTTKPLPWTSVAGTIIS